MRDDKPRPVWMSPLITRRADMCVCVPLQVGYDGVESHREHSALHMASKNGMVSTVAKLLAIGADAALVDVVLACLFMNVNTLGD